MSNPNYATGQIIRHGDYNLFVTGTLDGSYNHNVANVGTVWGVGYGRYGYGQSTTYIQPTVVGQLIRSQEWDNLDAILQATISHQTGPSSFTGGAGETVAAGQRIRPWAFFDSNTVTSYTNAGGGRCFLNTDRAAQTTSYTGIWGQSNGRTLRFVQTLEFTTADQARYFFNAGGKIKLSFSRSGGVASARNTFWSGLCTAAGTIEIGYKNTRKISGSTDHDKYTALDADNGGFWAQTSGVSKMHFKQLSLVNGYNGYGGYGGYGYGYGYNYNYGNYYGYGGPDLLDWIQVDLLVTNNVNSNGNLGKTLTITTSFVNGTVVVPFSEDEVSGTTSTSLVISDPAGGYITNTWGPISFNGSASSV